ncbi:MAG TPA: undecaprenyl-phosphate glucose phosphotransferase [Vicinamibacterales bacterium]|jgi:Undecaprenyl-phosphate glucose phosphotransferase|nr:undecaprenyl-phosphate glucose phosphotransferase [Vicinamibacterales bacterium]
MVKRYNRLLVAFYVVTDALLAMWAFVLAYGVRFESGLIPVPKGYPPIEQYLHVLPFVAVLTPLAFQIQGVYRLRRGRSRVDDFFAVLIGTILSVVFGVVSTLYVQAYFASETARSTGAYQVSQLVWALFLGFTVVFAYGSRETVRELLERRWRAGIGLKRVLIAGAGDLGRLVADRILQHRELGYQVVGFVDDRAGGDYIGYRGLPLLGTLGEMPEIAQRERIDHLYVALALDEHVKLLELMDAANREFVDVKVVPDLLQFIALRARLEDLDGLPVINVNDVPLQGVNAWVKRALDIALSAAALIVLAIPVAIIALLVRWTSPGPVFYRQERMGLDGRAFTVFKIRSMVQHAEDASGPVWARDDDPRTTAVGRWLRRFDLDELPQFWNVLKGDMSIVGPRPERPFFVEQFKHRIPQYMLRHKVKAGITGWAQVNGWRGNTSLEKRIEYDLYYIENWSVTLDIKIMWLTLVRGLFQRSPAV